MVDQTQAVASVANSPVSEAAEAAAAAPSWPMIAVLGLAMMLAWRPSGRRNDSRTG